MPQFIIVKLRSEATGRHFSSVEFYGDTDMATDGSVALTSIEHPDMIFITEVSPEEYQAQDGQLQCEKRLNSSLGRSDLRAAWFKRAETRRIFYRDIFDPEGEAELVSKMSLEEFKRSGGTIIRH